MSKNQADALNELLDGTLLDVSSPPKQLTLSNINDNNYEDLVEGLTNTIEEKLNFIVHDMNPEKLYEFNSKVRKLRSEFNNFLDQVERSYSSPKKLSMGSSELEQNGILRSIEATGKKSIYQFIDDEKENLFDLNGISDINLAKNHIDKISLHCDEKIRVNQRIADDNIFNRIDTGLTGLECSDEMLPKRGRIEDEDIYDILQRKNSESSMIIDEDDINQF